MSIMLLMIDMFAVCECPSCYYSLMLLSVNVYHLINCNYFFFHVHHIITVRYFSLEDTVYLIITVSHPNHLSYQHLV